MSAYQTGGRGFAAGAIVAALLLLGVVLWVTYPDENDGYEVPVIRADVGDYKALPDEPGGMDIPHRDSTVFSNLNESDPDADVENLLADNEPEEPMTKNDLFAGLNAEFEDSPPQPVESAAEEEPAPAMEPVMTITEPDEPARTDMDDGEIEAIEPAPEEREAKAEPVEEAKAEPAAGAATNSPATVASGTHFVQLASIRDRSLAAAEWKKMQAKYSVLTEMEYRVQEANLGDKGTFYRIQAGPLSKDDAAEACNAIKAQTPDGCLLVAK